MTEKYLQEKFLIPFIVESLKYKEIKANTISNSLIIEEDLLEFISTTEMNQKSYKALLKHYRGDSQKLLSDLIRLIQERISSSRNTALFLNTNRSVTLNGAKLHLFYVGDSLIHGDKLFQQNIFSVVQELPYKYFYKEELLYSFRPDISFFVNGIYLGYSELKSNMNNQTASVNGRGKVIKDYYEAVKTYYDTFETNRMFSDKEKEYYRKDLLKVFEKAIHITTTDINETYILRTITDFFDEIVNILKEGRYDKEDYEKKITKAFKPYPLLKHHTEKTEKLKEIFYYHYSKVFIEKEILYYNFIERDVQIVKGSKELKDEKGHLICPRPKQKFGTDKILSKIDEFLEHETDDTYFERLLEKQLTGVSASKKKELLEKRKAYSNNKNIYSLLMQYAAGFGKSNIIGWTALQLKDLRRNNEYVYDKILIVVDRLQLRDQLDSKMLNMNIDKKMYIEVYNKTTFQNALKSSTRLIIVNIQKFGSIREILDEESIAKLNQMRVVFLIDEIHRSNSGDTHEEMITIFDELQEPFDKYSKKKSVKKNLIIGFTATPSDHTLARFGEFSGYAEGEKLWVPFDSYTMQEAIEDGFILNPLLNIVPIASKMLFDIPTNPLEGFTEKEYKDAQKKQIYENKERISAISKYIAELLVKDVYRQIRGHAKAMLAVHSIKAARIYTQEIKKYFAELIKEPKYKRFEEAPIYTVYSENQLEETSANLNNGLSEEKVLQSFALCKNGLIIVVAKLQTGFDEKKLHTLFLDKEVRGINAIQTISRVNRTTKHKNDCKIIDFSYNNVNIQNIKEAFEHFSNVVVSDFDPFKDKGILELLYDILKNSDIYLTHKELFLEIYKEKKDSTNEYQTLETILEKYISGNSKLCADLKAKSAQYFTILNRIEFVIELEPKYNEESFLLFWRLFNFVYNRIYQSKEIKDSIEVFFDNKIGIIEYKPEDLTKPKKDTHKIAEGKEKTKQLKFDVLKIIEERNQKEEQIGILIKEFETKINDFFNYIRSTEEGKRLIAKIHSKENEEEIYEDFSKIYRKYRALYREEVGEYFFKETAELTNKLCDDFENTELKQDSNLEDTILKITSLTNDSLIRQLGEDQKWKAINTKIWESIVNSSEKVLSLVDFQTITKNTKASETDILTVISQLSSSRLGFLRVKYSSVLSNTIVSQKDLLTKIKAWKKDKTITDQEWKDWALGITIKWEPDFKRALGDE